MAKLKREIKDVSYLNTLHLLIGKNAEGQKVWLEAATYDCNWYWGFGYLHIIDGRRKDIISHTHVDDTLLDRSASYLPSLKGMRETVLTKDELWIFLELMSQFYNLKKMVNIIYSKCAGVSSVLAVSENYRLKESVEYGRHINRVLIPSIIHEVYELLKPEGYDMNSRCSAKEWKHWGHWRLPGDPAFDYENKKGMRIVATEEEKKLWNIV